MSAGPNLHAPRQHAYRAEIDGLRALALIPVILFHAGFEPFRGGYVGVDVFFVVSGYLITRIILHEQRSGTFSLARFYQRRARRILPALFFVILLCLPFAWLWMMPRQLQDFLQSLAAVALFVSNAWFARSSGYFDLAAEQKPLLHTWSLGVEEQYYALFPLCVLLLWRFGEKTLAWAIAAVALLSLAWSLWAWPDDAAARFYLTPTRAWELLLGCLVAFALLDRAPQQQAGMFANALAALGLLLIAAAVFLFDDATPFPGPYALVPAVGSALIIAFAGPTTAVGRTLSLKWLVGLGLISYSAYLWHQPLFAFARLYRIEQPSALLLAALCGATIPLAYLTWRYVEQPFRDRRRHTGRRILYYSVAATALTLFVGLLGNHAEGFPSRLTAEQASRYRRITQAVDSGEVRFEYPCKYATRAVVDEAFLRRFEHCYRVAGSAALVLGDSHAMDLFNAFAVKGQRPHVILMNKGCPARGSQRACYAQADAFIREQRSKLAVVFYTRKGSDFLARRTSLPINQRYVRDIQAHLREMSAHVPVVWLGPQAEPGVDLRNINIMLGRGQPMDGRHENRLIARLDSALAELNREQPFRYVSKLKLVDFDFHRDFLVGGMYTYSDRHHWSTFGEQYFGARLMQDALIASYLLVR